MKVEKTSIEANKVVFDWKDEKNREKGNYKEVYKKTINGVEVEVTDTIKIGRYFVVVGFEREYDKPVEFIPKDGINNILALDKYTI